MVATDEPIVCMSGARYVLRGDELLGVMREVFYRLEAQGLRPTHAAAGHDALIGYESVTVHTDPPVTTFKGIPITLAPQMERNRLEFWYQDRCVGVVQDIS